MPPITVLKLSNSATNSEVLIGREPVNLQPFDTIRIYSRYELDPPMVTIQGEIMEPGAPSVLAPQSA